MFVDSFAILAIESAGMLFRICLRFARGRLARYFSAHGLRDLLYATDTLRTEAITLEGKRASSSAVQKRMTGFSSAMLALRIPAKAAE
jgi:hypothetical protein